MYWAVMAAVTMAEVSFEWLVNWYAFNSQLTRSESLTSPRAEHRMSRCSCASARLPFYYQVKTLALLWLTLPQIDGASYVYIHHLHPWLLAHETDIDLFLLSAKSRAKQAGLDYARRAWMAAREMVLREVLGQAAIAGEGPPGAPAQQLQPGQQQQHQQSWFPFASTLMQQYGPSALAAGHAFLHPMDQSRDYPTSAYPAPAATPPLVDRSSATLTSAQRRQILEDELRSLTPPRTAASASRQSSPSGSSANLAALGGSYENIQEEEILALKSKGNGPRTFNPQAAAARRPSASPPQGGTRGSWFWTGQMRGEFERGAHPKQE